MLAGHQVALGALAASGRDVRDVLQWTDAAAGKNAAPPNARAGAAVATLKLPSNNFVYLFSGCSEVTCRADLQRLDVSSGVWTKQATNTTAPQTRKGSTLSLLGDSLNENVLMLIGGWHQDRPLMSIKQYRIVQDTWEACTHQGVPPTPRWGHSATTVGPNQLIVIGGEGVDPGVDYLNDVYLFSFVESSWLRLFPNKVTHSGDNKQPLGRMGHSATLIQTDSSQAIYVFGGYVQTRVGSKAHPVATNDVWALDLRGRLNDQEGGSPKRNDVQWIRISTIGTPPAARGHHVAAASPLGGNLFIAFGCDNIERRCYNDILMLDTTYRDGHRWQTLPVGFQRPDARHMLTAWIDGSSFFISGGSQPHRDARNDHCFSDVWRLELDGLLQGGKQLNATMHMVEDEPRLNVKLIPGQHAALAHRAKLVEAVERDDGSTAHKPIVRSMELKPPDHVGVTNATGSNATALSEPSLYVDTSLNDGLDTLSDVVSHSAVRSEECQLNSLHKCMRTYISNTTDAKSLALPVENSHDFTLHRCVRINPGKKTQEDRRIVGFGDRTVNDAQRRRLALAAARASADGAKESVAKDGSLPNGEVRRRLSTSFLQLAARSTALMPSSLGHRTHSRDVPATPTAQVRVEEPAPSSSSTSRLGAADWSPSDGPRTLPYEASRRVHGRSLHHKIELHKPTTFAHATDEPMVQMPNSHPCDGATPGLQHLAGEKSVHRQIIGGGEVDPILRLQRSFALSPPPASPSSPPSAPSPPGAPPPDKEVFAAEDELYAYGDETRSASVARHVTASAMGRASVAAIASALHIPSANIGAEHVASAIATMPGWAIVVAISGVLLLLFGCCCCCMQRTRRLNRRKAGLEDINPVFQTETWRKLE